MKELKSLGKRHPLREPDIQRAKILMGALKVRGYTNKEISYSVGGTWSIPTIKLYTRRLLQRRNISSEESLQGIFDSLVKEQLSIEEIRLACNIKRQMDAKGLTLEDVEFVINEANRFGIRIQDVLISWYNIRESGLTGGEIRKLLDIKRELDNNDISSKELSEILSLLSGVGGKEELIRKLGLKTTPTDSMTSD
jgi:hypothetical protein